MKSLLFACVFIASVGVGIISWQTQATAERYDGFYSEDFTPPRPITPEMQAKPIASIDTQYGMFVPATEPQQLPESVTIYNIEDVNQQTKQMILETGTFIKK